MSLHLTHSANEFFFSCLPASDYVRRMCCPVQDRRTFQHALTLQGADAISMLLGETESIYDHNDLCAFSMLIHYDVFAPRGDATYRVLRRMVDAIRFDLIRLYCTRFAIDPNTLTTPPDAVPLYTWSDDRRRLFWLPPPDEELRHLWVELGAHPSFFQSDDVNP